MTGDQQEKFEDIKGGNQARQYNDQQEKFEDTKGVIRRDMKAIQ